MIEIKVIEDGERLDKYLINQCEMSRSKIKKLIDDGKITVFDKIVKASYMVREGDIIKVDNDNSNQELEIVGEDIPLDIVYEDDYLLVVNKKSGMVVHPGNGNYDGTMVNALIYHCNNDLSMVNGSVRPGIVHRIDAYTTGLLVIAKNNEAHLSLAKQLEEKTTTRKYIALVHGVVNTDTGTIDAPIGRDASDRKKMAVTDVNSKNAVTHFKVLERYKNTTLIELQLETGRTHQIRVHMNYIGYPVVNDPVYGKRKLFDNTGQCLHAKTLGFIHPRTGKYMEFESELPECFTNILNQVKD